MSGWSYAQLVQAIKKANKSVDAEHPDPLLHTMRRAVEPDSFDENGFYEMKKYPRTFVKAGFCFSLWAMKLAAM
jgi:hypothetical protein